MTQIPSDDNLESLYKLRIRESEKLKTVLELYNMEIHQKKAEPDYHRLKTMVKRSIEQNLRMKNFEARNGNFETSTVFKNQRTKQRVQRILGDCWQWGTNGQCSKGNNCSFRHDKDKRAKSTQEVQVVKWLDCRARITSKGICTTPFCEKWHPPKCLFYKSEKRCKLENKCSHAHRQVDEQFSKKTKKNGDKSAMAMLKRTRQLGCVVQDT